MHLCRQLEEGVLELSGEQETVRLEACTFENNTVFQHNLLQYGSCGDSSRFYSDSSLDVWCEESNTISQTQPLSALPADTGILTAEDAFLTGLQQVCAGKLLSNMHSATKPASLSCARLARTARQAMLRGTISTCMHTGAC
jgi:hypothetical protein